MTMSAILLCMIIWFEIVNEQMHDEQMSAYARMDKSMDAW